MVLTARPDPSRVGGWAWARHTSGRLSEADRRTLLGRLAEAVQAGEARRRQAAGREIRHRIDDHSLFEPPDSTLARNAEEACREQPPMLVNHAYRTWIYGNVLAALDGVALDRELYYAGALLHDAGLWEPSGDQCFTVTGAEKACRALGGSCDAQQLDQIAESIVAHINPGATAEVDGPVAAYIQAGSMADFAGVRTDEIPLRTREQTCSRYPAEGAPAALVQMLAAEAEAFPGGRTALLMEHAGEVLAGRPR